MERKEKKSKLKIKVKILDRIKNEGGREINELRANFRDRAKRNN